MFIPWQTITTASVLAWAARAKGDHERQAPRHTSAKQKDISGGPNIACLILNTSPNKIQIYDGFTILQQHMCPCAENGPAGFSCTSGVDGAVLLVDLADSQTRGATGAWKNPHWHPEHVDDGDT